MTLTVNHLMDAMTEARRLSRGGLVLSVLLTDQGFVVLGAKDGRHIGRDVGWLEIEEQPGRLIKAVREVRDRL